jgi:hypothetical protein
MDERRILIYANFPGWQLISSDVDNFIAGKLYPLVTPDNWATCFYDTSPPLAQPTNGLDELRHHAVLRTDRMFDTRYDAMTKYNTRKITHDASTLLVNTILDLQSRNIDTLLLTPPYWQDYTSLLEPGHAAMAHEIISGIREKTGVPYLDYSHDPRFVFSPDMFHDSDHLSPAGAARFVPVFTADWNTMLPGDNGVKATLPAH